MTIQLSWGLDVDFIDYTEFDFSNYHCYICSSIIRVVENIQQRLPEADMPTGDFCVRSSTTFNIYATHLNTLQTFLADTLASFSARHPDYSILAGRVYAAHLHKQIPRALSDCVRKLDACSPLPYVTDLPSTHSPF